MILLANLNFDSDNQTLTDTRTGEQQTLSFSENAVLKQLVLSKSVATKAELQSAGWPNRNATDASLNQCISTLRRKLAIDELLELKTIPRHGYLLVLPKEKSSFESPFPIQKFKKSLFLFASLMAVIIVIIIKHYSSVNIPFNFCTNDSQFQLSHTDCHSISLPETQQHKPWVSHFEDYFSFAICQSDDCDMTGWLNLIQSNNVITEKQITDQTQIINQQPKIPRNQLKLPEEASESKYSTEQHYNHYIYYPTPSGGTIRVDFRMTLLYTHANTGIMTVNACISLLNCDGASIQYQARHEFVEHKLVENGFNISAFETETIHQELTPDQHLGNHNELLNFYRSMRRNILLNEAIWFYRLEEKQNSAIWQLPLLGRPVAWLHRQKLALAQ
ncbi:winged helix-turn-helix domain-containing protein [Shewanella sp. ENK2]|uniref:winged helix-turn-helix domain-containing protein n=1 Tax=Shewanella sp. ENK2 TaxID=2775245 RepID=UPI003747A0B0